MPKDYKYFTLEEFTCKCGCGKNHIDENLIVLLDKIRQHCGFPFVINSGYRCPAHNKSVGSTSQNHTSGKAADIEIPGDRSRHKIIKHSLMFGIDRIGIYAGFIHLDIMDLPPAIWLQPFETGEKKWHTRAIK